MSLIREAVIAVVIVVFSAACTASPVQERYIIYAHGKAIEDGGRRPVTRFGVYEYDGILEALRGGGFRVLSTQRPKDADVSASADDIVRQVRELIAKGVDASHITVIGASKGAVITMLASTRLQNPAVRYVLMGNCNQSMLERHKPRLSGRVLSIFESSDEFGGTCAAFFAQAGALQSHDEVQLSLGINHAFLYTPRTEWLEPALRWARDGTLDHGGLHEH